MEEEVRLSKDIQEHLNLFHEPEFDSYNFVKLFYANMLVRNYDMYDRSLLPKVLFEVKKEGLCSLILEEMSFNSTSHFPTSGDLSDAEYLLFIAGLSYNITPSRDSFRYVNLNEETSQKIIEFYDQIYQNEMNDLFQYIKDNYPDLLKNNHLTRRKHT